MRKHYELLAKWYGKSFFLRVRHSFVPLLCGSSLLLSANCGLSTSDLRWSHPSTPIYEICDKPLDVADDIDLWGFNYTTKELVTAEDPAELRGFDGADAFFKFVPDAPVSSASRMPPEYGLTCKKRAASFPDASALFFTPSSELFRNKEPCPAKLTETVGRADPGLFAQTTGAKAPCDSSKKPPVRVHVCVRPPSVGDVSEWGIVDVKGIRTTRNEKEFQELVTKAKIIFVFDESAAPESVYWFVQDAKKLSCPGKPAPKPYDQVIGSGMLEVINAATAMASALKGGEPKKGDGKTTETSGPDGKGPPLNFLESLARNLQYAGALASGDTSGDPKDPNGARFGKLGGKNIGGPDLLILQAATGVFAIVRNPFKTGKDFIDTVRRGLLQGKVTGILDPTVLTKEIAEQLAKEPEEKPLQDALNALKNGDTKPLEALEKFGKAMAVALQEAGVILPYSRAQIFTKGWGGKYQAHHALEVEMADKTLRMDAKAIDNIPAIILTEAEHIEITNKLNAARNTLLENLKKAEREMEPADLWQLYQKVYKDRPAWLEAIKGYFPNVP